MKHFGTLLAVFFSWAAQSQTVVYEGTLYDGDGAPLAEDNVVLRADILDDGLSCVMYSRVFTLDLRDSNGHMSLDMAGGSPLVSGGHIANTLDDVLKSSKDHSITCENNLSYVFNTGDTEARKIRVTLLEVDLIDIADVMLPAQRLAVIPFAREADSTLKLQGHSISGAAPTHGQVLRYNNANMQYEPSDVIASSIDWASVLSIPADIADGDDDTTYTDATTSVSGLMSATDKTKLDGVEAGAQPDMTGSEILTAVAGDDGTGSGLDSDLLDGQEGSYYLSWANITGIPADIADGDDGNTYSNATTSVDGLMSAADKTKLDSVIAGAQPDMTGSEILTAVSGDDGTGSGLDSDLLDGQEGSYYLAYGNLTGAPTIPTDIGDLTVGADSIGGNAIDGGTISNFASTGIDDNAATTAVTIDGSGLVGIGTLSPTASLDVSGGIRIGDIAGAGECNESGEAGRIRYNGGNLDYCNGAAWQTLGTASGGEVNTGSSLGSQGEPVFLGKLGSDLRFADIDAGSNMVSISSNGTNNTIEVDLNTGNIDIATLANAGTMATEDASDYYTQTNLQTSGQAQLHFNNLTNVPADLADGDDDTTYADATTSVSGLMSATDKTKLDGITAGAQPDMTGGEIVTALAGSDGTGSGLDSDLLDGQEGSYYLAYGNLTGAPTIPTDIGDLTVGADSIGGNAIDGGTISNFASTGIDDNAATTAVTIDGSGLVGIGTLSPTASLDVSGGIRIGDIAGAGECDESGEAGRIRYNGGNLDYCNGAAWQTLGTAAGGEVNTGSSLGSQGEPVFLGKLGSDLRFADIDAGSNMVSISSNGTNNTIEVDLNTGNIDIATLANAGTMATEDASDYYTQTNLQTSGQAQLHFDNLTNVPADLADGDDDTTYADATTSVSGLMSATDKTKLDGITAGAQPDMTGSEILTAVAGDDGTGSGLDSDLLDGQEGSYYLSWANITGIPADIADGDDGSTYSNATTSVDGLMSATDKTKLDGITAGAQPDMTGGEIVTALAGSDGTGSGLDSDLLDGQEGSYYLAYGNLTGTPTIPTDIGDLTVGADSIGGNAIDGGTISNFASTGIDDNAATTAMTIDSSGQIGIGTLSPTAALEISGGIRIGDIAGAGECNESGEAGRIRYNGGNLDYCNGAAWQTLGTASGGEVNTGSSLGSQGEPVFLGKLGSDLRFADIDAGSNMVSISSNGTNNTIEVDLNTGNIDIATLANAGTMATEDASDYYTQTNLQTSGQAQLHFNNLTNVPADLADGDDDTTYADATTSVSGLMSATDKTKLDGITAGAQPDMTGGEIVTALAGSDGTGSGLDSDLLDGQEGSYYLSWANITGIPADIADGDDGSTYADATTSVSGLMSATDKTKLDGITAGAQPDMTGGEIVTALAGSDGTGSGLDSDLLDGQEGSYYLAYGNLTGTPTIPTDIGDLTVGADSIGGNAIDGGTISNFASTGIDDNAATTAMTIDSSGQIGIGTASPNTSLEVSGGIRIGNIAGATECNESGEAGRIRYNGGDLDYCNGSSWITLGSASGGEVNSGANIGTQGEPIYLGKLGSDLQFAGIDAASNMISVTSNGVNDTIELNVVPGNIDIANLANAGSMATQNTTSYYTQTNMQTSGQAQLHFNNLTNVPADLADGDDDTTYADATTSVSGLMSATDKTKLDGITAGAQPDMTGGEIVTALAGSDGTGSGLDSDLLDGQEGSYYLSWANITGIPADIADGDDGSTYSNATTSVDGLMSATDKTKLDGITAGAQPDMTGGEIVTALAGSDGTGSGLDSDLLDGQEGSYYLAFGNLTGVPAGIADGDDDTTYSDATTSVSGLMSATDKTKLDGIVAGAQPDMTGGEIVTALAGSDGSGSGLDSDLLDGQTGSYYLAYANLTGAPTIPSEIGDLTVGSDSISGDAVDGGTISDFASTGIDDNATGTTITIDSAGQVGIGDTTPGYELEVNGDIGATSYYYTSDARLKENVQDLDGLLMLLELRGVSFDWKKDGRPDIGFIAQEVERVYPELVHTNPVTGLKAVKYGNIVAPLVEAVRVLHERALAAENKLKEVDALRSEVELLRQELKALKEQIGK